MREARDSAHEEGIALTFPLKPTDVAAIHVPKALKTRPSFSRR
jgi:hypothetical protein